jgi:phosphoglycerol transferase MdoB-like AlkP superfamily enzyme
MKLLAVTRLSLLAKVAGILIFIVPSLILINSEKTLPGKALSLLGIIAVLLFSLGLTWRLGLGGLISGSLLLTIIKLRQLKSNFMGQPFLTADIIYFFDQFTANVSILLRYESLVRKIALAAFVFTITALVFYKAEKPLGSWRNSKTLALRLLTVLSSVLIIPTAFAIINSTNHSFLRPLKEPNAWLLISSSGNILSTLILSYEKMGVKIPDRHFPDPQESRLLFNSEPASNLVSEYPDIILWHDESTFEPSMLEACNVPECQFNLYKKDAYTVANGLLKVHSFGGSTWTSEFSLLTGLNHQLFGEGGIYTHFTLAPRIIYSIPLLLKKHGYRTVALYPNKKHFFNAYNAYRHYGFDEFYAPEDLGLPNDHRVITDQVMYQEMAKILRRHSSGPIFIYVLTLFQHGPHNQPVELLPEPYKSLRIPNLSNEEQINLANYLYRLSLTDSVITELENNFLKASSSRKTIFLHYGDHQPSFGRLMLHMAKRGFDRFPTEIHDFLTQFSMKANFPPAARESYEYLDISFIGSLILDAAGLPNDSYFAANSILRRLCVGKYLDCDKKELLARYHDYIFYELGAMR